MSDFRILRRQLFLSEKSYLASLKYREDSIRRRAEYLAGGTSDSATRARNASGFAENTWENWQLRYTAGESLNTLAADLGQVVERFELQAKLERSYQNDQNWSVFPYDLVDQFVDLLNLISAAILLHREDLIPRIHSLVEGSAFDKGDAVVEELLRYYLPDRPELDEWFFKQYRQLLDAIDSDTPEERAAEMKKYVKGWYRSMKGVAMFYGADAHVVSDDAPISPPKSAPAGFTGYKGYWTMESAAFTYLLDIDDSSYRDEITYPKDLIDYARAHPRRTVAEALQAVSQSPRTRIPAGETCSQDGWWFSPAKPGSRRYFKQGEIMPKLDTTYGDTFWQWDSDQGSPKL